MQEKGSYSIVTDWEGVPKCVIETTNVRILPFKDITYDICKLEGEDDSLESWRIAVMARHKKHACENLRFPSPLCNKLLRNED